MIETIGPRSRTLRRIDAIRSSSNRFGKIWNAAKRFKNLAYLCTPVLSDVTSVGDPIETSDKSS